MIQTTTIIKENGGDKGKNGKDNKPPWERHAAIEDDVDGKIIKDDDILLKLEASSAVRPAEGQLVDVCIILPELENAEDISVFDYNVINNENEVPKNRHLPNGRTNVRDNFRNVVY